MSPFNGGTLLYAEVWFPKKCHLSANLRLFPSKQSYHFQKLVLAELKPRTLSPMLLADQTKQRMEFGFARFTTA